MFSQRSKVLLLLTTLTVLSLTYLTSRLKSAQEPFRQLSRGLHVAIINAPRYHFEVVLPLLFTFSRQRHVSKLELVAQDKYTHRFDAYPFLHEAVAPALSPLPIREPEGIGIDSAWIPDVIVLTSCMADLKENTEVRDAVDRVLTEKPSSNAICILHEVEQWQEPDTLHRQFAQKWTLSGRFKFLVLSEHVKIRLQQEMSGAEVMEEFIPVFPVADGFNSEETLDRSISVPRKYEIWRRSYEPLFTSISNNVTDFDAWNASVHLVGFGDHPDVPDSIKHLVHFHDDLSFRDYWRTLRSSIAIAPAFANDHYIKDKASSSIATALIVGVPLICGRDILAAYTYLRADVVWLLEDDEPIGAGFLRVLEKGEEAWAAKRQLVSGRRVDLEQANIKLMDNYLSSLGYETAR